MKKYEFLDHPADIKIRSFGKDLPELFINSALGMMEFLYGKVATNYIQTEQIEVKANNLESLLVDWLAEILYLSDTNKRAYLDYKIIEFSKTKIIADVGSQTATAKDDIKAVTYHELSIIQQPDGWQATVVYDI
jgi:SHS2 domain-containing protein